MPTNHLTALYNTKPASYAYIIGDTLSHTIDSKYASDSYITPASCQKVITALLAYKVLGEDYRYQTKLNTTKSEGHLEDIIITFSGDPTLTSGTLEQLLSPLQGSSIQGNIILDASAYQIPPHSPHKMVEDIGTWYGQPVSSMVIDQNTIHVKIQVPPQGNLTQITTDVGYKIYGNVQVNNSPSDVRLTWDEGKLIASGTVNSNDSLLEYKLSPPLLDPYIKIKVSKVLDRLGIQKKQKDILIIKDKNELPTTMTLVHAINSEPLGQFLPPALKISDNLVFDSLYLSLIHRDTAAGIEEWQQGDPIIKKLLKKHFDLDMLSALFVDGSGLSRYNRIQPQQLFFLLQKGYKIPSFVKALAKPGEINSSLANRPSLPPSVLAKTGEMTGICCLCGYGVKEGTPKTFVLAANNFAPPSADIYYVFDEFMTNYLENDHS